MACLRFFLSQLAGLCSGDSRTPSPYTAHMHDETSPPEASFTSPKAEASHPHSKSNHDSTRSRKLTGNRQVISANHPSDDSVNFILRMDSVIRIKMKDSRAEAYFFGSILPCQ